MNTSAAPTTRALILVAAVALSVPAARAQQVDTSEWICEYCPFESGYDAEYELGVTNVSDDSAYFGDASGYDESGTYANFDGKGSYASETHRMRWTIEDLALDSRFAEVEGGRQGTFDYRVAYRELPRRQFITTQTVFGQSAADTLSLPTDWVRAPLTSGFTALDSSLFTQNIESDRSLLEIGARYLQSKNLSFSADYRRHERDGVDVYAGSFFTQSSLLPRPFEYVTDDVDLGVRYAVKAGYVSLAWRLSEFGNDNDALRWDNPFTSGAGADVAALAQPPDNRFQQLALSGAYRFTDVATVVGFSAAMGRLEQNQAFLPYTTNPNVVTDPLPRSSLDGEVDTANLAFTVTSKVSDKARVKLAFRYDERDNQTPQELWTRVIADNFVSGESELNTPYSFQRSTFNLSGDYDLTDTIRASAGYDRKTMERDFQEVAEQTENSGWGRLRWQPNATFDVEVRGGASEREVGRYNEVVLVSLDQNPLMRKYNLAYRYRQFAEFTASVAPPESRLALTVTGLFADDDYTQSRVGLRDGQDLRMAADLSWAASEKTSLYLSGGYENVESKQFGSEQFSEPDWRATNDDEFYTVGAGFRMRQLADKVDLQMDYTRSDGTSEINIASASDGDGRFPDLTSTLDYLRLKLVYHHSERIELTANVRYQGFKADDWALEGVGPATIPVVLTLGAQPYDDDVVIVGIGFRYKAGAD